MIQMESMWKLVSTLSLRTTKFQHFCSAVSLSKIVVKLQPMLGYETCFKFRTFTTGGNRGNNKHSGANPGEVDGNEVHKEAESKVSIHSGERNLLTAKKCWEQSAALVEMEDKSFDVDDAFETSAAEILACDNTGIDMNLYRYGSAESLENVKNEIVPDEVLECNKMETWSENYMVEHLKNCETVELSDEYEKEFNDIKEISLCEDSYLMDVIGNIPRMRELDMIRKVKTSLNLVQSKGVCFKDGEVLKKKKRMISLFMCFLQTEPDQLRQLLSNADFDNLKSKSYKKLSKELAFISYLRKQVEMKLMGTNQDRLSFLLWLLGLKSSQADVISLSIATKIPKISAIHLKEKVDYLNWQGITNEVIKSNIFMLLIPLKNLDEQIVEIKSTLGETSIQIIRSRYYSRKRQTKHMKLPQSKVFDQLGTPSKEFTDLQRACICKADDVSAISVLDFLLSVGIKKSDIVKNPYILGYDLEKVKICFEKYVKLCNTEKASECRKLLNLVVYDLEYGSS